MRRLMSRQWYWLLAIETCCGWASWRWYCGRVRGAPEELWELLALLAAIGIALALPSAEKLPRAALLLPTILLFAYAVGYHALFPLARAALLMGALAATVSAFRFGTRMQPGMCGLVLLALPIIPSLQFYCGFPLRILVANLTVWLLRLSGVYALARGNGVEVGAYADRRRCSVQWGENALDRLLSRLSSTALRFGWRDTILALVGTLIVVVLGNALRAAALFLPEAGLFPLPAGGHDGVGIFVFALTAAGIVGYLQLLQRRRVCAR